MKPKDLLIPCSWEKRCPLFLDRLLYVPKYYFSHEEKAKEIFSKNSFFPDKNPIVVEYCSGNGQWIIDRAKKEKEKNFIAVEMCFDRMRKIWVKMHNQKVKNLFIVFGEALTFTKYYLLDNSISSVFVNFPDPWPKKRHAKHRLVKKDFVEEISRIVKEEGTATFVSDDFPTAERIGETIVSHKSWHPFFENPYYKTKWADFGSSYFKELWEKKGKSIYYLHFAKIAKNNF